MTSMFALLERRDPAGPLWVRELWPSDPGLPRDLKVVDVSAVTGIVVGWVQKPDGGFGPFVPALDDAKADRARTLRFDCFHEIVGGFTSAALGAAHSYGSSDTDRENIDRAAMAALSGQKDPKWTAQVQCAVNDGPMSLAAHTAAQVHQVSSDLHAHIEAARVKRDALNARIAAATTVAEVEAITWG